MQKYVNSLEVENKNLKNEINELKQGIRTQKAETTKENVKSFFGKLKHNLST